MTKHPSNKRPFFLLTSLPIPDRLALFTCTIIFFTWLNFLVSKFTAFGYYDWDLAIYANAMWALTHGSFNGSLWGTNFLTNHAEYISIFLVPIYWLFPSALTLITLKLFSLTTGGYVFYLIAKNKVGWPLGLLIMLLYFAFPANFFMLIFEFHFESLAIAFLFLIYYYLRVRTHYIKFIFCCLFASLCKENIPPVIFMFGFMSLFEKKNAPPKFAWTAIGIGAGIFILEMFIITPLLRHSEKMSWIANPYISLYWNNHEKVSFMANLITNLNQMRLRLFNPLNATYVKDLFFPLLCIPVFSFTTLATNLPLFLQAVLSNTPSMHTIFYHYAATVAPFLFLAAVEFIAWVRIRLAKWIAIILTLSLAAGTLISWSYHKNNFNDKVSFWHDNDDRARWSLVKQIPPTAGVTSTFEFLSYLANRSNVYPLRNIWNNQNIFKSNSEFIIPQTSFALIDWGCIWIDKEVFGADMPTSQRKLGRLKDFYFNNNWQVIGAANEITLLKRLPPGSAPQISLIEVQKKPFQQSLGANTRTVNIDNKFQLLYSEVGQSSFANFSSPLIALTFYWKAQEEISDLYNVHIRVFDKSKFLTTFRHKIGYAIYATPIWQGGDYIKETYWLDPATFGPGKYTIAIAFGNITKNYMVKADPQTKNIQQIQIGSMTIQSPTGSIP